MGSTKGKPEDHKGDAQAKPAAAQAAADPRAPAGHQSGAADTVQAKPQPVHQLRAEDEEPPAAPHVATAPSSAERHYRRPEDEELIGRLAAARDTLLREIKKVIVGQDEVLEQVLITMFCRSHALMVGVPGLAKTLIVRTIAQTMNLDFKRIQFTPDLMPSDITGTEILEIDPETQRREFRFQPGPVFTNILLADEINRTPPKTQAALLECMQEYRVTAGGRDFEIQQPFFVLATQNPIEQEGTYPLPEAQLDRFMLNILVDYPSRPEELEIVKTTTTEHLPHAARVMDAAEIVRVQQIVRRVPVSDHVLNYVTDLVRATRPESSEAPQFIKDWVEWGAGPRAAQYLVLGAKAHALIHGRTNVSCSDVRTLAHPVLRHRVITSFNADSEGITVEGVIDKLLENIPEPDEEFYARKKAEAPAPPVQAAKKKSQPGKVSP